MNFGRGDTLLKQAWNILDNTVKNNPWRMIFISGISAGITAGIIALVILPKIPAQIFSWLLFPLSAGSFAAIANWIISMYKERQQLDIFLPSGGSFFFFCSDSDIYPAPNRLVVYIRISNLSPVPISLMQFDLEIPGHKSLHSPKHVQPLDKYKITLETGSIEEKGVIIPLKDNLIKPIVVLSPYHGVEGYLFFPMCPDIKENEITANLTITTTRGIKEVKTLIKRITSISTRDLV